MPTNYNAKTATDGLLLCLDAANPRSVPLENLLKQSESLSVSPWATIPGTGGALTVTDRAIAGPFSGPSGATRVDVTAWASGSSIYQDVSAVGTRSYKFSVYFYPGTQTANITFAMFFTGSSTEGFNATYSSTTGALISNTALSATSTAVGNGWYRWEFTVRGTVAANNTARFQIYFNGTGTAHFWGAQVTNGYSPSTYLQTTSTATNNFPNIYGRTDTSQVFAVNEPGYVTSDRYAIKFDRTSTTPKRGGTFKYTTSGSLLPQTFLYNNHTWEVLARLDTVAPSNLDVTEGFSVLSVYRGYHSGYFYTGTTMYYYLWDGLTTQVAPASWNIGTEIIQGQWFHLAVTKSGTTWSKYLNGKFVSSSTATLASNSGISADLHVGAATILTDGSASYSFFSKMSFGNMKMYNRALTANEVHNNFNALRGRFGL